jgi:hypothetical protein
MGRFIIELDEAESLKQALATKLLFTLHDNPHHLLHQTRLLSQFGQWVI